MTAEQIAVQFEQNGYVSPLPILNRQEVERYRCEHDRLEADRKSKGITTRPTQQHMIFKPFWDLAMQPRVESTVTLWG